jgi:hypothetical protein
MSSKDAMWQNRAEDIVLAMDRLSGLAARIEATKPEQARQLRMGAMAIRLVIACRLGDVIRLLDPVAEADPSSVMAACEAILQGDRPKTKEIPLVSIGQGEYAKEILERDLVSEVSKSSWMFRAVAAWRTMRGVA